MLRSVKDMTSYNIAATDGELGSVKDVYFDDERWVVRYVVVDTGKWLPGRLVLISPVSVKRPDWVSRLLSVSLTQQQVKDSPPIEADRPVSRRKELQYLRHYGLPPYWGAAGLWGAAASPLAMVPAPAPPTHVADDEDLSADETHLRSCREVTGYALQATDGELGHIEDFLFDDLDWAVRYIVVDTRNWWFGGKVVISPEWVDGIDWSARTLRVDVSRDAVKNAPAYNATEHINRQWEADYYAHHGRSPYWTSPEPARKIKSRHFRPPIITK
jgi:hypothetical protein